MALQLGSLRTALIEAGASEEKADRAAEEVAGYDSRLASLETRLSTLTWMTGTSITLIVIVLGGQMALWAKLGEIAGKLH